MRSLTGAEWNIRRRAPRELFEALDDLPPLTVQILHGRGHDTPEKVRAFLDGPLPPYDPYLLTGMDRAGVPDRGRGGGADKPSVCTATTTWTGSPRRSCWWKRWACWVARPFRISRNA